MSYLEYVIYENYNVRLPSHWNFVPIRRGLELLTDFEANGSFAYVKDNVKLDTGDNFAWYLRATDLENKRYGLVEGNRTCDEKSYNYLKKTELEGGELLIAKRGEIGKVYSTPTFLNCKATLAPNLYLLKLEEERLLSSFAVYWFKSDLGNQILLQADKSTTIGALYKDDVKACLVAFPPIKEQQKIAAFLDYKTQQIDQLIEKKKALIEKLEEKRIAVITQAVTKGLDKNVTLKPSGVDWLGDVPEHWDVRRLKFIASIENGRDYKDVEVEDGGFPVYGSGGEFRRAGAYLYEGESVLFGRKGTIDKPLYVSGCFWTVDTMFYSEILPNTIPMFLYYSALTFQYQKLATQTALPSITQNDLENYLLCYPELDEQNQIVLYLARECRKIDEMLEVNNKTIDTLEEYRTALITSAVTGKIDVREVSIPKEVA